MIIIHVDPFRAAATAIGIGQLALLAFLLKRQKGTQQLFRAAMTFDGLKSVPCTRLQVAVTALERQEHWSSANHGHEG